MREYEYEGKLYRKSGAKWTDSGGAVVPVALQNVLNRLTFEKEDLIAMSYEEAKVEGDKYKESESYSLAIRHYEHALSVAETYGKTSALLPRITSCYRKLHRPERVIEILADVKLAFGERILNEALLTSAAAAYCDMGQPEIALRCCRHAYAMLKNKGVKTSIELHNVYSRASYMRDPIAARERDPFDP